MAKRMAKQSSDNSQFEDIYSDSSHKVNKKHYGKPKRFFVLKKIGLMLLSIIFTLSGAMMIYYYKTLDVVNFIPLNFDVPSSTSSAGSLNPIHSTNSDNLLNDPMILNVMLFGSDRRSTDEYGRSDTMIMLSIDNRTKTLKMTSFLRDMWVEIPGYGSDRLNAAYSFGGPSLAILTLESNFGIRIDRYAVVDFTSFKNIVDILGGIDIELSDFEIDYINWQLYKNNQADTRYEIDAEAGIVHLNGQQALWHARNRDSLGSDFDRTDRQRQVLNVIINEVKQCSFSQLIDIVSEIGPKITTNFKKSEITTLVSNALTYLKYDVEQYKLPAPENYYGAIIEEKDVLVVSDWDEARLELAKFVFGESVAVKQPE